MNVHLQCSTLQTAVYLVQAIRLSLPHNPDTVFTITCDKSWHGQLNDFLPGQESRLILSTEIAKGVSDVDLRMRVLMRGLYQSIPRMFVEMFRQLAGNLDFVCGLNSEDDLLFPVAPRFIGSPSRVLFINEPNTMLSALEMDCLIQSIIDRRLSVTTASESDVRDAAWQPRSLIDYAFIASQADYVVGAPGAHMAVSFNQQSINKVNRWIVLDPKFTYPFNGRCHNAQSWSASVALLKQYEIL